MHGASSPNDLNALGSLISYGFLAGLAIALLAAGLSDLAQRRISNRLNAVIALSAPLFWWASGLSLAAMGGQLALGLGVFAVLAALFAAGAVGGGDVKLLAALALWIRPLWFVQLLVVMALAGGVLSVLSIVWRLRQRERRGARGVPYGIAIALGGLWVLVCDYLPLAAARVG